MVVLLAACSPTGTPPPPPAADPPATAAPVQKKSVDYGTCEVNGEKVTPNVRVVQSKYWDDPDVPGPPLSVNCIGKDARVSFAAAPGVKVPFGPHTYKLEGGRGEVVVMARVKDKQLAAVSGTIDVTVFDDHHLTGTIDLTGTGGTAKVALTGSFDFRK